MRYPRKDLKFREKLLLSLAAGALAMLLSGGPMWWGVLFSPITESLTAAAQAEEDASGFRFQVGGQVFRFKTWDMLLEFLRKL